MNKGLTKYKREKILMHFCEDIPASKTSRLTGINRNTVNRYYSHYREHILSWQYEEVMRLSGEIEVDESYFGARRVRGKRGRGAAGKTPVFGLLKRGGKVFVTVVASCSRAALMPIIEGKVLEGSTIYSDGWKAYDGLILNGYDHYRVFHSKNEFVRGKSHINGIEAFWSFAKRRLAQFNGIKDDKFILHLAECQFRYNNRNKNLRNVLVNEYAMLV
ncbi:MAG: IS1595 family transposase [Opitutales bacterium]|jgi:transposase|nr:IS1595 family transposase [Opitutales bacterium]